MRIMHSHLLRVGVLLWVVSDGLAAMPAMASSLLQVHTVIDEPISAGEAPDIAQAAAFVRARLEIIDHFAKLTPEFLKGKAWYAREAAIADHVHMQLLRVVEQAEPDQLHVLVEVDASLDPEELTITGPHTERFRLAKGKFQAHLDRVHALRARVLKETDPDKQIEERLQLEMLGLETAQLACFAAYALAGADYCDSYRRNTEEDYRLATTVVQCGGAPAWKVFSPFRRIAAFLSVQLQAFRQHDLTAEQALWRHLGHKQVIAQDYPYLRERKEMGLLNPIEWPDPNGGMRRVPIDQWSADMITIALEREVALWGGMAMGWKLLLDGLSPMCAAKSSHHDATIAHSHNTESP